MPEIHGSHDTRPPALRHIRPGYPRGMPQPYEQVTSRVAQETGAHAMDEREANAVLRLARQVAQASDDRRAAPLVSYLAGQVTASEFDAAKRTELIEELTSRLFPAKD